MSTEKPGQSFKRVGKMATGVAGLALVAGTLISVDATVEANQNLQSQPAKPPTFCLPAVEYKRDQYGPLAGADLDHDGLTDLVARSIDGLLISRQDRSTGRLFPVKSLPLKEYRSGLGGLYIADLILDSRQEIVAFPFYGRKIVIFTPGDKPFDYNEIIYDTLQNSPGEDVHAGGLADIDGDGRLDLVWDWSYADRIKTALNQGDSFSSPILSRPFILNGPVDQILGADVTGDGEDDVLVMDGYSSLLYVVETTSNKITVLDVPGSRFDVARIDSDNIYDIAVAADGFGESTVFWGGALNKTILPNSKNIPGSIKLKDMNNDGTVEAVEGGYYMFKLWGFNGRQPYEMSELVGHNYNDIGYGDLSLLEDLNNDGKQDIAYGITVTGGGVNVIYQEPCFVLTPYPTETEDPERYITLTPKQPLTRTPRSTRPVWPTYTPSPSKTPGPSNTPEPTDTALPTNTPQSTRTPRATRRVSATPTVIPSRIPDNLRTDVYLPQVLKWVFVREGL